MSTAVSIGDALAGLQQHWSPQELGRVNDTAIKAVKIKGTFPRHVHDDEDECFLVLEGTLTMRFDDREETIGPGEMIVVPAGVHHEPHCDEEVRLLLIEPASTVQYGDAGVEAVAQARATV